MANEGEELALHAVLKGEVKKKLQWLQERGVSLEDERDAARNSTRLLTYIEIEQITSIPLDELKTTWSALEEETFEKIKALVEGGADISARDKYGQAALHVAAGSGNTDAVSLLLDRGADVNAVTSNGRTALHDAARNGSVDTVSLLLDRGADVNAVDKGGRTALHDAAGSGNTDAVSLLLGRGADVNAVDKYGQAALHDAAGNGSADAVSLLLDRGANIDAVDKENHSPLINMIWSVKSWKLGESIAVARLLCSRGSNPILPASADKSSLEPRQLGLLACANHWRECYERGEPLPEIQSEVIEGGEDAVKTYLDDLANSLDQLVYRSKVCIVGPGTWGKTSLVKSITENKPSEIDENDRTIGIDLFPFSFDDGNKDETDSKKKSYDVTFWDFAGQDIYQVTHALFFSERTLYLICIDLSAYAEKLEEVKSCAWEEKNAIMQRFFEENVLRWVRLIRFRQPSAQFKAIGTKKDLVSDAQLNDISNTMNDHMDSFLEELDSDEITKEVKDALDDVFKPKNLMTTSVRQVDSIKVARKLIKRAIIDKPRLSFKMTVMYTQVLQAIFKIKQDSERSTQKDRVTQVIMPFGELREKLRRYVPDLNDAKKIREILRVLHRLGDILWYEDKDKGKDNGKDEDEDEGEDKDEDNDTSMNPGDFVILDSKIMLDSIREVVNHKYEEKSEEKGKFGESYEALRRDGTLNHSLLVTFPLWNALEAADSNMVHLFKYLLQHLGLAYPARNGKELNVVDMIVPAYWKTREKAQQVTKSLTKQPSVLTQSDVAGLIIAKWHYSLPFDISEVVYVNFVVRCYRRFVDCKVGATYVEYFIHGEFNAVINFTVDNTKSCDDIMIEVAAATKEIAWAVMRDFVMAMEEVLLKYPGFKTTNQNVLKRYIVDPKDDPYDRKCDRVVVNDGLIKDPSEVKRLQSEKSWFPPDFDWFIQRAWTKPGMLDTLKAQKTMLQLDHRLNVLQRLIIDSETCRFPAMWTLSYSNETRVIELRIHSDLTGVCHHMPLKINVPNDFLLRHGKYLQVGISILSVASACIPSDVVRTAVDMALPELKAPLERAHAVNSIIEKADLIRGEVKSATDVCKTLESRRDFLSELLSLHCDNFKTFNVGEIAKLCCATVNNKGYFVWVHETEFEKMKVHLGLTRTEPDPPDWLNTAPQLTSTPFSMRVAQLMRPNHTKSRKKIYCEWEIVHSSGQVATGKTEKAADSEADIAWPTSSSPVESANVSAITILQESTLTVSVKQSRRLTKFLCSHSDKVLGQGEEKLKKYIDMACSSSKPVKIEIKLGNEKISPCSTVICEISVKSTASSSP